MRKFLATWVVIQLIFIGYGYGVITKRINNGTYECFEGEVTNSYVINSTLLPLTYFVDGSIENRINEYCNY